MPKEKSTKTFNFDIPVGLYELLNCLIGLKNSKAGISTYARGLLEKHLEIKDLPNDPERRLLSIRMPVALKENLQTRADGFGISPAQFGRRLLTHGVREEIDALVQEKQGSPSSIFLVFRGWVTVLLLFLCFGFLAEIVWYDRSLTNPDRLETPSGNHIDPFRNADVLSDRTFQNDLQNAERQLFLAYKNRGKVFFDAHLFDEALRNFENAYAIDSQDLELVTLMIIAYEELGNLEKVEKLHPVKSILEAKEKTIANPQ